MSEDWDVTDDDELKDAVRNETQYDEGKLSTEDLDGLLDSAKRVLSLKAGVTDFYSDRGLAVALLGVTCAKAKGAVENSPVRVKNVAGQDITLRTPDGSSLQVSEYEEMARLGLAKSDATDEGSKPIMFTRDFLSESSSR